jgi:predicted nucleic acid-binding protein
VTAFIDTAVLMYAGGADHPLRQPCRRILDRIADGELDGVTSVEVVQEVLHRFIAVRRPEIGVEMAQQALDLFAPVLPLTHAVMRRMPDLVRRYPTLATRDLVHVATCHEEGIQEIVSPDRGFDAVAGLHRLDPTTTFADGLRPNLPGT